MDLVIDFGNGKPEAKLIRSQVAEVQRLYKSLHLGSISVGAFQARCVMRITQGL